MNERCATVTRKTGETSIVVSLELDGEGRCAVATGVGFLDHMLNLFGHHSGFNLEVKAEGDLEVDDHHVVEDVGLTLGQALRDALADKKGIERFGSAMIPMDEVLVAAAVDLSGRPIFVSDYEPVREQVGDLSTELVDHFFASLSSGAKMALHLRLLEPGRNEHHRIEAMFKGFARALGQAVKVDTRSPDQIPSTKGVL